jgi:hypothetical protein
MRFFQLKTTFFAIVACSAVVWASSPSRGRIGQELAMPIHLQDGEEYRVPIKELVDYGRRLFTAMWTIQDGAGRPLSKGTGAPLSDMSQPLIFPRSFNRISGPDTNSCSGCHNKPYVGGGGDIVSNVFVLGQRFDFISFNASDLILTSGARDERDLPVTLQTVADSRKTIGMFGAGYIEMLARQITADLQTIRDGIALGQTKVLLSKGISFGALRRRSDGTWDVSGVEGLPALSIQTSGTKAPNLIIRPFHQAGNVISLRQFTNNAFNHHHGMQAEERFGTGVDADGDGMVNELTRADITAATIFQATLPPPGRVIPNDPEFAAGIKIGEDRFARIGCASCHIPALPLTDKGWVYTEPNLYNPAGNLQVGDAPQLAVDLSSDQLPGPRLKAVNGVVWVPAFTDFKLHDITDGLKDPNREPLDQNQAPGTDEFFAGSGKFITRKLWGIANQHSFGHHGMYTTLREAVLAHAGEATNSHANFNSLNNYEQDCVIEFLKSLQILPANASSLVITDDDRAKVNPREY